METTPYSPMLAEKKSRLFSLLAQALNYPDMKLVERIRGGEFGAELIEALQPFSLNGLGKKVAALKDILAGSSSEETLLDLERDYTWMCFASKPRLVYLFESVYKEGKLLQESTFEIARLYYEAGLNVEKGFQLPPDHIAVELEFMAYLGFNEAEALREGDQEKIEFARRLEREALDRHLRSFGLSFSERMEKHAKTDFYRIMAKVLMETLTSKSMT